MTALLVLKKYRFFSTIVSVKEIFSMKNKKNRKEHWFSPKGIIENFKSIHFLQFGKARDGSDGIALKYGKTVFLMIVFALIFMIIDVLLSMLMHVAGLL